MDDFCFRRHEEEKGTNVSAFVLQKRHSRAKKIGHSQKREAARIMRGSIPFNPLRSDTTRRCTHIALCVAKSFDETPPVPKDGVNCGINAHDDGSSNDHSN